MSLVMVAFLEKIGMEEIKPGTEIPTSLIGMDFFRNEQKVK
ncbi:MAG: hypothetical protein WA144_11235 [Candidatus Methanoperedens sp.]